MFDNSQFSKYDSPYAGGGDFIQDEGPVDQAKNFLGEHGKKLVAIIVILAIGIFVYDFFIGSYQNVTFSVVNTENKAITGATIMVQRVGETESRLVTAGQSVSLKKGNYNLQVSASGYEDSTESYSVTKEETYPITLNKKLVTNIVSVAGMPKELYLGQTTTGQIVLKNPGAKKETVELVLTGDLAGIDVTPVPTALIDIDGGQSKTVDLQIKVPGDFALDNLETGDDKTGTIQIRFTQTSQDVKFKILPASDITIEPDGVLTQDLESGTQTPQTVQEIKITNNSAFDQKDIKISLELDPSSPSGSPSWFSFSTTEIAQIAKSGNGNQQTVIFYAKVPVLNTEQKIGGQSKIIIKGISWKKEIQLNLTAKPKISKLLAMLSSGDSEIQIQQNADHFYEEITTEKINLENQGELPISQIDAAVPTSGCLNMFVYLTTNKVTNLGPGETGSILLKITAPAGAVAPTTQKCTLSVTYDEPLTGRTIYKELPLQMRLVPSQ